MSAKSDDVEKTEGKQRIVEIQRDCADLRYEIRMVQSRRGFIPRKLHCSYHCSVIEYQNRLLPAVMETSEEEVLDMWGAEERDGVKEYPIELTSGKIKRIEGIGYLGRFSGLEYKDVREKQDLIEGRVTETDTKQDLIVMGMLTYIHDDLDIIAHKLGYGSPVEKEQTTYMLEVE
jgi:hypothetical protein